MAATPSTRFSYAQLEQLWIQNGGPASVAPVAAAVAEAESGGNPAATNPTDNNGTQTSWGLWQVSNGTHAQPAPNILDPNVNAAQAVAKYKGAGNSFSPWGTYTSGAYKGFVSGGTTPDPNVPATTTATLTAATQAAASASSSTCLIGFTSPSVLGIGGGTVCIVSKASMRNIVGAAMLVSGGVLVLAGAVLIAAIGLRQSGAVPAAARVAGAVKGLP